MSVKSYKKILIIGLIDDIGGREIETKNIINALSENYEIRVVSLFFMTSNSEAIKDVKCNWSNIYYLLYKSNVFLKLISFLVKKYHQKQTPTYFLVDNKISRKLFDFHKLKLNILKKEIDNASAVLYCGTMHLNILNDVIKYCHDKKKPFVIRTTGKIKSIPKGLEQLIQLVPVVLVHSITNANLLKKFKAQTIEVIDQTTLQEQNLLTIPVLEKKELTFGYLGRFSEEKGVIELLKTFNKLQQKLIVAGSGPLQDEVNKLLAPNITILETISPNKIADFFKSIDVLIIPSKEEAGPLVGIEAMASGKLIISTRVGAMEDRLLGTLNNFWFDISDTDTLVNQIQAISNMESNEVICIKENVRQHYIENYSVNRISKKYIKLFDNQIN